MKRMSSGVNYFTGQMKFMVMEEDSPGKKKVQVVNESDEDSLSEDSADEDTILSDK